MAWEDNIKMDLMEIGCEDEIWMGLAQDRFQWRALVQWCWTFRFDCHNSVIAKLHEMFKFFRANNTDSFYMEAAGVWWFPSVPPGKCWDTILKHITESGYCWIGPERGDSMFLRNVGTHLQVHTASQPGSPPSTYSPPWEPQISRLQSAAMSNF
jgi:hypothetical protein